MTEINQTKEKQRKIERVIGTNEQGETIFEQKKTTTFTKTIEMTRQDLENEKERLQSEILKVDRLLNEMDLLESAN